MADDTQLMIYGAVGDSWAGLDAASLVPAIDAGNGPLTVAINSPGGLIIEGMAIYAALQRASAAGRNVTCRIDGLAASMASILAMAGDEIIMAPGAMMMIHNPWDIACGDAEELRSAADLLDKLKVQLVNIYAARSGQSAEDISALMDAETWLNAEEALAQGFCTAIGNAASAMAVLRTGPLNIKKFGFRKAPDHPLIAASAMAIAPRPPEATQPQGNAHMSDDNAGAAAAAAALTAAAAQAAADAIASERQRASAIRALGAKHGIHFTTVNTMVDNGITLEAAREQILEDLATRDAASNTGGIIRITADESDKWLQGASNWLIVRGGMVSTMRKAAALRGEKIDLDPGEFRGITLVGLATEALHRSGARNISRDPQCIVGDAFIARGSLITARGAAEQGTGDFPVLLENTMHKVLQASYQITPDTWSLFCGKGTVTDFRPSNRYLRGTFGSLDSLNEQGEFKNKSIPDGEKETISAGTKGNIIALSRQAIINDDMGAFITLSSDLGRAAKLTIEKDVYALLASNPTMYDGYALFSNQHRNLAGGTWTLPGGAPCPAAAAIGVASFDAAGNAMASQLDPSNNEILDIRPEILLLPRTDLGAARVIVDAKYDTDVQQKFEVPNKVQGIVESIVSSPRLSNGTSGHGWYFFADKESAPAIEVVFLNGVDEPFLDNTLGWRIDGTEFKVREDYGVGAVNWRSAYYNPGI